MKKTRPKKQVKKKPVRKIARKSKKIVKKAKKLVKKKPRKKLGRKKPIKKIVRKSKKTAKKTKRTYSVGTSLERLFESPAKVQTMKLFFRNPEESFLLKEAARAMRLNL